MPKNNQNKITDFFHKIGTIIKRSDKARLHRSVTPSSAAAVQQRYKKRRALRIKNRRRVIIAASTLGVVIAGALLLIVLTDPDTPAAPADTAAMAEASLADTPAAEAAPPASATLTTPVYAQMSITEGMTAAVVTDIQIELMALGYMGEDAPDGVFSAATKEAVERFQTQHEIDATGNVNNETYSLLFSEQAQYYTLSVGIENDDVMAMQERLIALDYMSDATGYYGTDTEAAVQKFQQMNKIDVDGQIGQETRELLYSEDAVANAYSEGESNDDILAFQKKLQSLGYLTSEPDGVFGGDTKAAVQRFQENSGLIADGYIGPQTRAALLSDDAQGNALAIGAKGDDVMSIQERMKELGYISKATGYFGSDTDTAVRWFQNINGLSSDGKVGARTMSALMSSNAKEASGVAITGPNVESFIRVAESKLGSRYVLGAKGPDRFDCSGFAYWCLNQVGIKQSYMTSYRWRSCTKYTKIEDMDDLRRGDIIIYYGHVAICAGNGYMIDASSSNGKVVKRKYTSSSYWSRAFYAGFRVF